jgi:hypothetical protein
MRKPRNVGVDGQLTFDKRTRPVTTLDGNAIFGNAVTVIHNPHPNAQQINQYFGIDGQQTLFGGTRGRAFVISGVLSAPNIATLNAVEATLLSYADGLTHTLVDNRGRVWPNVIFRGEYTPSSIGPRPLAGGGWCLPYRLMMEGLT